MKKYVLGILGGLICGLVAALPWILVYIFGEMILSLLAIPIAIGVNWGYRKFGGTVDKKLPIIIIVISLLIVLLVCFVILPLGMLAYYSYDVSLSNLTLLYGNSEFVGAIMKDSLFSIVFAILGISGIVSKVRNEVNGVVVKTVTEKIPTEDEKKEV